MNKCGMPAVGHAARSAARGVARIAATTRAAVPVAVRLGHLTAQSQSQSVGPEARRRHLSTSAVARSAQDAAPEEPPEFPLKVKPGQERPFEKILIANRGEIACRIIRTCQRLGIKTVAVYSDADAHAMHVRMADEAVRLGPAPSSQSYLDINKIVAAVRQTGAQAVHPGYGFLSENPRFVKALDEAGVAFVGPSTSSMAALGDKIESKVLAKACGVHTVPGFDGAVRDAEHAASIARDIGYPVMVKASAGGGGKGMRIARNDEEVAEAFKLCTNEAASSFGDTRLLVEKYVEHPRHIEIQVIGDTHGNIVYLPERECSIQRRNQKVIEEAPSVHLDPETRRAMGEQAVQLARRVGYYSAGTVEFLVDPQRNFYFLEMNTRLQVEHPITEYVTGLDLVECMLRVAAGQHLPFTQRDVRIHGWAVEARVYAEDPERFLPSIGRLTRYIEPETSGTRAVRCDSGVREGSEISVYYDPMICKLCTWAPTRDGAIVRMQRALDDYVIKGVTHNIPLLREVVSNARFREGRLSTAFLPEEYPEGFRGHQLDAATASQLAAVAAAVHSRLAAHKRTWVSGGGSTDATPSPQSSSNLVVRVRGQPAAAHVAVSISPSDKGFHVAVRDSPSAESTEADLALDWTLQAPLVHATWRPAGLSEGEQLVVQYLATTPLGYVLSFRGTRYAVDVLTPLQAELARHIKERPKVDTSRVVLSPMPGTVVSLSVKPGDTVAQGTEVAIVEAMKMQNVLRAPRAGTVSKVHVKSGQSVSADEVLVEFASS